MTAANLLSVIVPTHNRRDPVLRAVQSVLDQSGFAQRSPDQAAMERGGPGRLEIIVVDDGSSDDTVAALQDRFGGDPRFRLLSSSRGYASAARNLGFSAARGNYVCFLDSDDFWLPDTWRAIGEIFATHPELAFVSVDGSTLATSTQPASQRIVAKGSPGWSHARFKDAPLTTEHIDLADGRQFALVRGDFFPAIVMGDLFYLSGLVMRRECVAGAGPFNERFRYFNDWEFFARLCAQGPGAYADHDGFRRESGRPDQISRNRPALAMARRHLYIAHSLLRRKDSRITKHAAPLQLALSHARYSAARELLRSPHRGWSRRYLLRCIRDRYKVARCIVLLALSFAA